jgi:hypothetical protein
MDVPTPGPLTGAADSELTPGSGAGASQSSSSQQQTQSPTLQGPFPLPGPGNVFMGVSTPPRSSMM